MILENDKWPMLGQLHGLAAYLHMVYGIVSLMGSFYGLGEWQMMRQRHLSMWKDDFPSVLKFNLTPIAYF